MFYADGREVRLGDRVKLGDNDTGVVVCSVDTDEYTEEYPAAIKESLVDGVVFRFSGWGDLQYGKSDIEPDLILLSRKVV